MAPKRRSAGEQRATEEVKRYKESVNKVKEGFTCCITHELLFDPVTAEDGHLYERSAIEEWIARRTGELKSPKTNERMGPRLMPATPVRSIIEQMVRDEVVSSPAWTQKLADEREVRESRERAEEGDTNAMYFMGKWYQAGQKGLPEDLERGFSWFERGHRLGGIAELTRLVAECYLEGIGVEKDEARGQHLLRRAEERGSGVARFLLGVYSAAGMHGLPKNAYEATHWFRAIESATEMTELSRQYAAEWLRDNAVDA